MRTPITLTMAVLGLFISACNHGPSSPGPVTSPPDQPAVISITLNMLPTGIKVAMTNGAAHAGAPASFAIAVTGVALDASRQSVTLGLNFGDGTDATVVDVGTTAASPIVTHVYNAAGHYTGRATLTVTFTPSGALPQTATTSASAPFYVTAS
jgi:hypothetical protein